MYRTIIFSLAVLLTHGAAYAAGDRPSTPTNLSSEVDGNNVVLRWDESTDDEGVEGYNVYRDSQYIDTVKQNRYEGPIDSSRVQRFHVVAFDSRPRNFSRASETIDVPDDSGPVDPTSPPTKPGGLTGDISGSSVNITWAASTDDESVRGYNVYENDSYLTTVSDTAYSGSVEEGEIYSYYVVAFDHRSNFSKRSDTLILPDAGNVDTTIPPETPDGLAGTSSAGANGDSNIVFTWNAAVDDRGVSGYNVYVNDSYRDTVFSTSFSDVVPAGAVNGYSVVAFDIDGNFSSRSENLELPESDEPVDTTSPPTTPTNLSGTLTNNGSTDTVSLSWSASIDNVRVVGYNVYKNDGYIDTVFDTNATVEVPAGSVNTFFIVAFDQHSNYSGTQSAERITLPESAGNQPPYFVNLEDQIVYAGPVWEFVVEPRDDDGGVPGLLIGTLPQGMQSVDNLDGTRTLRWQPLQPAVGMYDITFTAFDPVDSDIRTVRTITLDVQLPDDLSLIPNRPPTIDAIGNYVVRQGDNIVMRVKAVDANGTVPNLTITNMPSGATFELHPNEPRMRVLRWQSGDSELGIKQFNFEARDAEDSNLVAYGSGQLDFKTDADFIRDGERLKDLADQAGIKIGYASLLEITEQPDGDLYSSIASEEFNLVTPENSMKWGYINPEPGEYRFEDADALMSYANDNGMEVHGHALVWYTQNPQWVHQSPVSEREDLMNDFIDTMVGRYPDVAIWDVVNEAFNDNGTYRDSIWYQAMGSEHIDKAFIRARERDADTTLIYNDYDVAQSGPKADAMVQMVADLVANGVPIDGVGFQMHLNTEFDDFAGVEENFQRIADLGLDVYVTELDVVVRNGDSDAQQAEVYEKAVEACVDQPACKALQIWGFTDRYTWRRPNPALILDSTYQPKAAYGAVQSGLK